MTPGPRERGALRRPASWPFGFWWWMWISRTQEARSRSFLQHVSVLVTLCLLRTDFYFSLCLYPPVSLFTVSSVLCFYAFSTLSLPSGQMSFTLSFLRTVPYACSPAKGKPAEGTMGSTLQVEVLTTRWHSTKLSACLLALMRNLSGFLKSHWKASWKVTQARGLQYFLKFLTHISNNFLAVHTHICLSTCMYYYQSVLNISKMIKNCAHKILSFYSNIFFLHNNGSFYASPTEITEQFIFPSSKRATFQV